MKLLKNERNSYVSLIFNFTYATCNFLVGFWAHSWWFITVSAYYTVLAATRFSVLHIRRKAITEPDVALFAKRVTGILLILLSFCLIGVNLLSAVRERGTVFHEIIMIAIATYFFTKVTLAIIGMAKSKKSASPIIKTLRNITFTDAVVSIYSLQRSMLVSFPGLSPGEIQLFNILTGTAVWLIILFLGINLIGGKKITMAKLKLVKATDKIATTVKDGYQKIEKGVVGGYKKIEKGVTDSYKKIEDKFVNAYLTKEGESVEEAKARLKKENK